MALRDSVERLNGIAAHELPRKEQLGKYSLDEAVEPYTRAMLSLNELTKYDLRSLGEEELKPISSAADNLEKQVAQLTAFSVDDVPANQKIAERRDNLLAGFTKSADRVGASCRLPLVYFRTQSLLSSFDGSPLSERESQSIEIVGRLEQAENQMRAIIEAAREASGNIGASKYAQVFEERARVHEQASSLWLRATIAMVTTTVAIALVALWLIKEGFLAADETPAAIQLAVAKLFILSILYYSAVWCGRNYRSHQHNYLSNMHRHNALRTFDSLIAATDDGTTRDAVLMKAADAIFSLGQTGYLSGDGDDKTNAHVFEVLRSSIGPSSRG